MLARVALKPSEAAVGIVSAGYDPTSLGALRSEFGVLGILADQLAERAVANSERRLMALVDHRQWVALAQLRPDRVELGEQRDPA